MHFSEKSCIFAVSLRKSTITYYETVLQNDACHHLWYRNLSSDNGTFLRYLTRRHDS